MTRKLAIAAVFIAVLAALGIGQSLFSRDAEAQSSSAVMAPYFEVDPMWPKSLPNGYFLGTTIGVSVDAQDHVWIVHRPNTLDDFERAAETGAATCCKDTPPIIEFDQAGNLLRGWGGKDGPGYQWPGSNHGIWVDFKGNVWIGSNGQGDGHILKFTKDGKFLRQFGRTNVRPDSNATDHFSMVAKIHVYQKTNEVFVADGYGNKRVAVLDADTGAMKRYWGGYGNKPDDTPLGAYQPDAPLPQQFRGPVHCAEPSNDGLVYVCDRQNDRLQVFTLDGKFVKEIRVEPNSRGDGSTWDVAFSTDPPQKYLYLADGRNQRLHIYDRESMTELTNFGQGGHYPGEWIGLHSIAVDSKGNIYTTETYQGRRVQKFTYKGLAPVSKKVQGAPWPPRFR